MPPKRRLVNVHETGESLDSCRTSKRHKTNDFNSFDPLLPREILILVVRSGGYARAGKMARTCKTLLKTFCSKEVLTEMILYFLHDSASCTRFNQSPDLLYEHPFYKVPTFCKLAKLPQWLYFSLPRTLVSDTTFRNALNESLENEGPLCLLQEDEKPVSRSGFVTGGYVCRVFHTKKNPKSETDECAKTPRIENDWAKSDVDVWVPSTELGTRASVIRQFEYNDVNCSRAFDYVPCDFRKGATPDRRDADFIESLATVAAERAKLKPHRCIERFDLSIVQQGLYFATEEEYCTPLSLFTLYTNLIVANIAEYSIGYDELSCGHMSEVAHLGLKQYKIKNLVENHCCCHLEGIHSHFFNCAGCLKDITINVPGVLSEAGKEYFVNIQRWYRRLKGYYGRFPLYKMTFVYNPNTHLPGNYH
jgi:hypothetical protein